jgi:hypothetical protein
MTAQPEVGHGDLDALGAALHEGWLAHMAGLGWSWGPRRDASARQHPDFRAFGELSPGSQARERGIAAALLRWMTGHGFGVMPPAGAAPPPPPGSSTPAPETAAGLAESLTIAVFSEWAREQPGEADLPGELTARQWRQLASADKRAQDRAAVSGFLRRLDELGYRICPEAAP